jgi:hypothetical protein
VDDCADPGIGSTADRGTDPKADATGKSPLGYVPPSALVIFAASTSFWIGFSVAPASSCPKFSYAN